ncbi:hypothetical protein [Ferrovibrio sp.]|uniref:hypothetical protein n=1 Tax=Ferrovibrio sp. TaxID=1917215 RepID=UPI0035B19BE1
MDIYRRGQILRLEQGTYETRSLGVVKVKRKLDVGKRVREFISNYKPANWLDEPSMNDFVGWLEERGYVAYIENWYVNLGEGPRWWEEHGATLPRQED